LDSSKTRINIGDLLEARVGIEPSSLLQTRKLLIPRSDKNYKNDRNTEVRYMAGTRVYHSLAQINLSLPSIYLNNGNDTKPYCIHIVI